MKIWILAALAFCSVSSAKDVNISSINSVSEGCGPFGQKLRDCKPAECKIDFVGNGANQSVAFQTGQRVKGKCELKLTGSSGTGTIASGRPLSKIETNNLIALLKYFQAKKPFQYSLDESACCAANSMGTACNLKIGGSQLLDVLLLSKLLNYCGEASTGSPNSANSGQINYNAKGEVTEVKLSTKLTMDFNSFDVPPMQQPFQTECLKLAAGASNCTPGQCEVKTPTIPKGPSLKFEVSKGTNGACRFVESTKSGAGEIQLIAGKPMSLDEAEKYAQEHVQVYDCQVPPKFFADLKMYLEMKAKGGKVEMNACTNPNEGDRWCRIRYKGREFIDVPQFGQSGGFCQGPTQDM